MKIEWRPVVGFEGFYEVSNCGDVKSLQTNRILKYWFNRQGYKRVALWVNRTRSHRAVHQIVLEAFIGPRPKGFCACHNDGDKTNNSANNLRWDTHKANCLDKKKHGTENIGERHGNAKLTMYAVKYIRESTLSGPQLARMFGVTKENISIIRRREGWKHIT